MKILFLSSWFPYPPDNGSKIRVYHLLRALVRRHDVTLITFADAQDRPDVKVLRDICRVAAVVPTPVYHSTRAQAIAGLSCHAPVGIGGGIHVIIVTPCGEPRLMQWHSNGGKMRS